MSGSENYGTNSADDVDYEPDKSISSSELESNTPPKNQRKKKQQTKNYRRITFSAEDEEKLIEAIKSKPFLYNVADKDYKDRFLRTKAWSDIANILSKSSEDCKKKWKNLRDQYEKSRKKQPTGSGASSHQMKRIEMFSFLDSCSSTNVKYVSVSFKMPFFNNCHFFR